MSSPAGDDTRWIVIPKWTDFQHYKDRSPTWIKNYTRLLSDDAYLDLTHSQRGLLHGLWLLRASMNEAPSTTRSRHLLATNKGDARHFQAQLDALKDKGFIDIVASKPLAEPYRTATLEVETEKKELRAHARTKSKATEADPLEWLRDGRTDYHPESFEAKHPYICPLPLCGGVRCRSERHLLDHLYAVHHLEGQDGRDALKPPAVGARSGGGSE